MSLDTLERALRAGLSGAVLRREPMARHTTYRIGGPAELFIICDTVTDLGEALRLCDEEGIERVTVGKGSNLLVADTGYAGAVITLGREFKSFRIAGTVIETGAACVLAHVVRDACTVGLSGMEFAVGIPGTIGGAISMNAGTGAEWIDAVTRSVRTFVPGHGLTELRSDEIDWAYRSAGLMAGSVVVAATLELEPGVAEHIRQSMDVSLERRRRTQPQGLPSAGSVFRNPAGDSAGRLIESVGLKGRRLGGARISEVHANFIVNEDDASAQDVRGLVHIAQTTVRETYGIELTPEIKFLGAFEGA